MTSNKHFIKEPMVTALVALLPVLFTFPLFEPDFDVGLDSSYVWGLNYLFGHDYPTLTHLLYPYGPLALLKLPVATDGHYAIFLGFYILVKWALVALTIGLARKRGLGMPLAALLTLPMCVLGNTDTYIVGVVALLVLWVVETRRLWPYVAACVLSAVALAIKISIGAQCCAILFIGWLMTLFQRVRDANAVAMPAIVAVVLAGVGLIIYRSVPTLVEAAVGMLHLVGGYSDALVLEPPHRLWTLLLFVAAMAALLIVVRKDRGGLTMFILLLVPLYANWRHGILREDVYHFGQLVYFACCFATLVALSGQRRRVAPWIVGGVAVVALIFNRASLGDRALTTAGPTHVYPSVIRYDRVVQRSLQYIDSSLALRKLPTEVVQVVGNTPTDCYPWEQLYCAANGFVWQPHATIETGAGNSLWLNRKSAENFAGPNAVGYVVLHPANSTGDLRTLDGRYMLNDEPPIIEALVSGYQPVHEGNYGLLLQRREAGKRVVTAGEQTLRVRPNEWLQLPPEQCDTVWRIAVPRTTNFVGSIRSLLYKPDVCVIDLLMPDSTVQTFRYSPATSAGGLWVSPLPTTMGQLANMLRGEEGAQRPVAVRFGFTHARCHAREFDVRLQAVVVR